MISVSKLKKALWLLPAALMVPAFMAMALTGQQVYDQQCAGCHKLGTYDTSGSPDLLGKGSLTNSYFANGGSHKSRTVAAGDLPGLVAFVNNPTTTPTPVPVAISTSTLAGATVGTAYSQTLTATGGTTPYRWSVSAGTLPAGLTLSTTGAITGTPTTAGTSSFTVRVTDSATTAASATKALSITVAAAPTTLTITTATLAGGTVGSAYSQALAAGGGKTPYTWSLASGTLPAGLAINATGTISGTPSATGTSSFTVRVTDSSSPAVTATKALSITVAAAAAPLTVTTTSLAGATVGAAYSQNLAASGGTPPYTWSYSGTLPPGIVVNSSGTVSGTPTTAGSYSFTVLAADSAARTATRALSIAVGAATTPMSSSDKTLFINNCLSCHTPSGLQGRSAAQISAAIAGNVGGMGTAQLKALTSANITAIARTLTPTPKPVWNCTTCHGATIPTL